MEKLLKKAMNELSRLPDKLQNEIAIEILDEIKWNNESFENDKLDILINKARKEHKDGKTHNIGFNEL